MNLQVDLSVGESTSESSLSDQVTRYLPRWKKKKDDNDPEFYCWMKYPTCLNSNIESLSSMCTTVLANNFTSHPIRVERRLPPDLTKVITSRIPLDLDPKISALYIQDENYWKRTCVETFGMEHCSIGEHGLTWKRLYFERYLQRVVEDFKEDDDFVDLLDTVGLFQDHIFTLRLRKLPPSFQIDQLCKTLPNLTNLDIQYGAPNICMEYDKSLFGMKMADTECLGKAIQNCSNLTSLTLSNSQINDDLLRMFIKGLGDDTTLTLLHLDVSHNKVTTNGLRLLANKVLAPDSVLISLNLADNRIHAEGGRCLGRLLRSNKSLLHFDVRLNRLDDEGGKMLIEGIRENDAIEKLNLSSNSLASESAHALCSVFGEGISELSVIDLSSNQFSEEDMINIGESLEHYDSILCLDLRRNGGTLAKEAQERIDSILHRNEMKLRSRKDKWKIGKNFVTWCPLAAIKNAASKV